MEDIQQRKERRERERETVEYTTTEPTDLYMHNSRNVIRVKVCTQTMTEKDRPTKNSRVGKLSHDREMGEGKGGDFSFNNRTCTINSMALLKPFSHFVSVPVNHPQVTSGSTGS